MDKSEMISEIKKYIAENTGNYPHWAHLVGVRYDNKQVAVGDELAESRDNSDRDDSRDFPQFNDDDYNNLPSMGGTSAYHVADVWDDVEDVDWDYLDKILSDSNDAAWDHASIVIGMRTDCIGEDDGEIIMNGCEVVKILW